ncbi:unnamed protein product [Rhizophagus irregularis]|nr:unnamed protein product [Rhizophagus irregularis]
MVFRYSSSEMGLSVFDFGKPGNEMGFRCFDFGKRRTERSFRRIQLGKTKWIYGDDGNDPVLDVWIMEIKMNRFRAFWIMEIETNRNAGRNYDPNFGDGNVKWTRFRSLFSGRLLDGRISKVPGYRFNILKVLELRNYWIFVI